MPKTYIPVAFQRLVIQRARGFCEYCLLPLRGLLKIVGLHPPTLPLWEENTPPQ
jgi:hypothetical protein